MQLVHHAADIRVVNFLRCDTLHRLIIAYTAETPVSAVPFHLTNVYALCQRLMTLIILINCPSLIKTSQLSVINATIRGYSYDSNSFPRRFDPKCEVHRNSIWYISFVTERKKCSIHCYRHCRPRNETFAFHRSEIAYFMYLRKVRRIMLTSWGIRMPISRHFRQESEPWNSHFFYSSRVSHSAELSMSDRSLYFVDRVRNTKYITHSI